MNVSQHNFSDAPTRLGFLFRVAIAALLGLASACSVALISPGEYQRSATVLLVPSQRSVGTDQNSLTLLPNLAQASDVLVAQLSSEAGTDQVLDGSKGVRFSASRSPLSSGPILTFTITGGDDEDVRAVQSRALATAPALLNQLQSDAGVPSNSRARLITIAEDGTSSVSYRTTFVKSAAVGLLTAAAIFLLLRLRLIRRIRAHSQLWRASSGGSI